MIFAATRSGKRLLRSMGRLIHPSAWKEYSPKSISSIPHNRSARSGSRSIFRLGAQQAAHYLVPPHKDSDCCIGRSGPTAHLRPGPCVRCSTLAPGPRSGASALLPPPGSPGPRLPPPPTARWCPCPLLSGPRRAWGAPHETGPGPARWYAGTPRRLHLVSAPTVAETASFVKCGLNSSPFHRRALQ